MSKKKVRVFIKTYTVNEMGELIMAVYIAERCGLTARVEFVRKNEMDSLSLYVVRAPR